MKNKLILLLLLLSRWGNTYAADTPKILFVGEAQTPNIIRIPFSLSGSLVIVMAVIEKDTGQYIFDSGATRLILNSKYYKPTSESYSAKATAGVTGGVGSVGNLKVGRFQLDNLIGENINAETIDLGHIESRKKFRLAGLIGYAVFADFEVILDYQVGQILLVRTDKDGARLEPLQDEEYQEARSYPILLSEHIAKVELTFGNKKQLFGLDTGAEQNLLDHFTNAKFLKENFKILRRVKLKGTGPGTVEVLSGLLMNASMGEDSYEPMLTLLTDMTSINTAYNTQLDGVLGYEFLKQKATSVNYKKRMFSIF